MSKGSKSEADKGGSNNQAAQDKPVEKLKVKDREATKVTGKGAKPSDSAAEPAKKKQDDSQVAEQVADLRQFFSEVWFEFRKISWPDRAQVIRETYSVLVLVTIITVMVLAFDFAVARVVFEPLDHFAKKIGGGLGTHSLLPEKSQSQGDAPPAGSNAPAPLVLPVPGSAEKTGEKPGDKIDTSTPTTPPAGESTK